MPPKGAGLNLAWIPQVMGNYFRRRAFPSCAAAPLPRLTATCSAGRHRQPNAGRALLARSGPYRQAPASRPAEATLPWLTVVGEIGDVKDLAADVPTKNSFTSPAARPKPTQAHFHSRHAIWPWWLHCRARPTAARADRRRLPCASSSAPATLNFRSPTSNPWIT